MGQPNYPDQFKVKIGTEVQENDVILQTAQIGEDIHRRVIRTQEEQFREALISLGWTPPSPAVQEHCLIYRRGEKVPKSGDLLKSPIYHSCGSLKFIGKASVERVESNFDEAKVYVKIHPLIT